jgi:2-polyprenyl-3-methyl-5-hydroxy-6-metoxy-1,4-benzoquinol methylase
MAASKYSTQNQDHLQSTLRILDVGCGYKKHSGAVGIDYNKNSDADVIHNLNEFPYPFKDDEFDVLICNSILEHLDDVLRVLEELHRISKPNAIIRGRVPHYSGYCAYADPTHKRSFSYRTFDFFSEQKKTIMLEAQFRILSRRLLLSDLHRIIGLENIINLFPKYYEKYLCYFSPILDITFELQVIK